MSVPSPANLDALRAVVDPAERAQAALAYVAARQEAIAEARRIRDAAIRELVDDRGVTATAREVGLSVSQVKAVRRG